MKTKSKRLVIILLSAALALLLPFLAMQFTSQVNWSSFDFLAAGILLVGTGLAIELGLRKIKGIKNRIILVTSILLLLLLVWAELSVGIFGTPFAGS